MSDLTINIDRDGLTGGIQLSAWEGGYGLRLGGPKFSGASEELATFHLSRSDLRDLRGLIDEALAGDPKASGPVLPSRDALIRSIKAARHPDGTLHGFPTTKVAGVIADQILTDLPGGVA